VRDEVDALLTPVEDVEAVAKALKRLITDPALGQRLVEGGRERIAKEYAVHTVVAEWRTLFARFGEA